MNTYTVTVTMIVQANSNKEACDEARSTIMTQGWWTAHLQEVPEGGQREEGR